MAAEPSTSSECPDCGGIRHVWFAGKFVRCRCFFAAQRQARYREGGFAERWRGIAAAEAVRLSKISTREPEYLERFGRMMANGQVPRLVLVVGDRASTPEVMISYLAWTAAERRPVWRCDLGRLVEERFDDADRRKLTAAVRDPEAALFIRLGYDDRHAWLGSTLARTATDRHAAQAPTVFYTDLEPASFEGLYGAAEYNALMSRIVRY